MNPNVEAQNLSPMLNEHVRDIMTKNPTTVNPSDTIQSVTDLMMKKRLQQLPVVDAEKKLVGIITSYDLWRNSENTDANDKKVQDVMSTDVLKIAPKDKVGTAAELFLDRRFKTIPVVNLDNELKGVVTAFDVIRLTMQREYDTPILYKDVLTGSRSNQ